MPQWPLGLVFDDRGSMAKGPQCLGGIVRVPHPGDSGEEDGGLVLQSDR